MKHETEHLIQITDENDLRQKMRRESDKSMREKAELFDAILTDARCTFDALELLLPLSDYPKEYARTIGMMHVYARIYNAHRDKSTPEKACPCLVCVETRRDRARFQESQWQAGEDVNRNPEAMREALRCERNSQK